MDVDDRISNNHVEKMVEALRLNSDYNWVSCKGYVYSENNLCEKIGELGIRKLMKRDIPKICFSTERIVHQGYICIEQMHLDLLIMVCRFIVKGVYKGKICRC